VAASWERLHTQSPFNLARFESWSIAVITMRFLQDGGHQRIPGGVIRLDHERNGWAVTLIVDEKVWSRTYQTRQQAMTVIAASC
jgi:hypothetical protein